jgi:hypothetical protein
MNTHHVLKDYKFTNLGTSKENAFDLFLKGFADDLLSIVRHLRCLVSDADILLTLHFS